MYQNKEFVHQVGKRRLTLKSNLLQASKPA